MNRTVRPLAAEFLGTFGLVFVGAGAVVMDTATGGGVGLIGVALANAMVIAVMVTATMNISGAHINPAVTVALLFAKQIDVKMAGLYIATQLLAGVAAAFLLQAVLPPLATDATNLGTPRIAGDLTMLQAITIEATLTVFLVSAVFGTVVSPEAPRVGGFAIGMVLLFAILVGGPLTGAALNPVRAFGPALVAQNWEGHMAYWVGPIAGALVAAVVWVTVLLPKKERPDRSA